MKPAKILVLSFLLSLVSPAFSQTMKPGPQVLTFFSEVDDSEQPYGVYIPPNFNSRKKYPLVIMLHGAGSNHRLALRRVFGYSNAAGETDVEASRYFPKWTDVEFIVASPLARGTMGYQGITEKDVYDVLADVKSRFNIDEDRIYLTGLSMGGGGTLWIGLTRPDIWAALAPVCPAPPRGTEDFLPNSLNLPMHFFHGDADKAVPVSVSREWVEKLKANGTKTEYKEYPGVEHNSWEFAYENGSIFNWFSQHKRNLFPEQVRFNTRHYRYNKAYWVEFDRLTPGAVSSIDAKFVGSNQLNISTRNLEAFTLNLDSHPSYRPGVPLEVVLDGNKIKANVSKTTSFMRKNGKWLNQRAQPLGTGKRTGAEGPLSAAFSDRHVYVYGTKGNPSQEELNKRMDVATYAANWSQYRNAFLGRVMVFPRVIADKDVRPSDIESANLILFGTAETNTLIERYAPALPMQLSDLSGGKGLLYVYPVQSR
jgi:poly(3-hydroxybutyrate) depolymerase